VDEDVDIYSIDDVMWAIMSRTNPATDFFLGAGGSRGVAAQPGEQATRIEAGGFGGGLAIDATVPFLQKERFERSHYAVDQVDFRKWLSEGQLDTIRGQQSEYARCLAKRGW
jgi:3-polyprenyl-4-hydroxybenzoate decarboxylase